MKYIQWTEAKRGTSKKENLIMTPAGPFNSDSFTGGIKFWVGDTNFVIDQDLFDDIDNTNGVVSLCQLTPFKFMVTIGRLFSEKQILKDIENLIKEETQELLSLKESLKKYEDWAIFVLPNGNMNYTSSEDKDFDNKIEQYVKLQGEIGGRIITPNTI
jgi:hypothetical protein